MARFPAEREKKKKTIPTQRRRKRIESFEKALSLNHCTIANGKKRLQGRPPRMR